jgi:hypothetical protein
MVAFLKDTRSGDQTLLIIFNVSADANKDKTDIRPRYNTFRTYSKEIVANFFSSEARCTEDHR